jgi:LuxR family maltose regulon positive regulatory protein
LAARLDGDFRLALVSAPAGYGKTATLASWAATVTEPVAWLSCDSSDTEPNRFMTGLLSAIEASWPGAADDAFVLLDRDAANTYDAAVAAANELASVDDRGVIVVDDLHLAAPDRRVLTRFLDALPDRFRFVAGTRTDPPLSLGRLRVRGELLELRSDDLRFAELELADFFGGLELALTADELRRVHELTEGWPAGVQLAAIALQRRVGRDGFLEAFGRTDRSVGDFLLAEVLENLPADVVEFLLATSVLDSFDAELCAEITGVEDAALMLDRLLAANLFVVPLDGRARRYRYHHLFGAFLRARLASLGTGRLRAAHDRAGRALHTRGDVAGSLEQAMAIGDAERVGEIVQHAVAHAMSLPDGEGAAVQAIRLWLHRHGEVAVRDDPARVVVFLIGLVSLCAGEETPAWLDRVSRAHPEADGELRALIEAAWGEYRQRRGEPLAAIGHEEAAMVAVDGRPPSHGLLPLLHVAVARAYVQAGDMTRANVVLEHALAHPVGSRVPDEVRHPGLAAFVAARGGELSRAAHLAGEARRAADELDLGPYEPGRIFADLARVELLVERHADDEAGELLEHVNRASEATNRLAFRSMIVLQHARTSRAFGDEAAAAGFLEQARVLHEAPDAALLRVFDEEAALQALRFDSGQAVALIGRLPQDHPSTRVLRARLALLEHGDRAAAALLADLPAPETRRVAVERFVLSALSVLERDVETANAHLRDALALAQPERLVRTVTEAGPDVNRLLKSYPPRPGEEHYVEDLLSVANRAVAPVRSRAATSLVEPLSDRELTVLRYLCSRLTYQEIAAALYVSLNTLKSHVRAVYRKLGVSSRADAVEAGRAHALI